MGLGRSVDVEVLNRSKVSPASRTGSRVDPLHLKEWFYLRFRRPFAGRDFTNEVDSDLPPLVGSLCSYLGLQFRSERHRPLPFSSTVRVHCTS